jgi:hypothetical protein
LRLMVKALEEGALDVVAVAAVVAVAVEVVAVAAREVGAISDVSDPDSTAAYRVVWRLRIAACSAASTSANAAARSSAEGFCWKDGLGTSLLGAGEEAP